MVKRLFPVLSVHCKEYSYYIWIVLDYMMCVFQLLGAVTGQWQSHKHVILSILSEATGTFLDFYLKTFACSYCHCVCLHHCSPTHQLFVGVHQRQHP